MASRKITRVRDDAHTCKDDEPQKQLPPLEKLSTEGCQVKLTDGQGHFVVSMHDTGVILRESRSLSAKATASVPKVVSFTDGEDKALKRIFGDQLTAFLEQAGRPFSVYLTEKRDIENLPSAGEIIEQVTRFEEQVRKLKGAFAELHPVTKDLLRSSHVFLPDQLRETVLEDALEGLKKITGPCLGVRLTLKPQRGNPGKDLEKNLISDLKAIYVNLTGRPATEDFEDALNIILPHAGIKTTDRRRLRKKTAAR